MMAEPDGQSSPPLDPTADPVPATQTKTVSERHKRPADPEADSQKRVARPGLELPGYELHGELGRGGMGVVYRAHDLSLNRDVAVKILHEKYAPGSFAATRFVEEARITGQLQHPGIPPIHAFGSLPDGRPFLAMKLIKGRTLDEILKDYRPTSRGTLIAAFEQICQAVAYAHSHGVIHRDLKPHNVMVGAFGEIQVMDWGLAKFRSESQTASAETSMVSTFYDPRDDTDENSKTRAGSFLGTPAYMSPEQALGAVERIDERSDVFGLGAVLCTILTGEPPFVGETAETIRVLAAQGKVEVAFARLDACGAERELTGLCKQCLSSEQAARPANAGVVARAVGEFRVAADARARQAELDRVKAEGDRAAADLKVAEQRTRRKIQTALGLSFTALLLVVGAFAWWRDRQSADQRAERSAAESRAEQAVESAVALAVGLREKYRFAEAELALDQAEALIPPDSLSIREKLAVARGDLAFVRRLDEIRMSRIRSNFIAGMAIAEDAYAVVFRERGIDPTGPDSNAVGDSVAASPIKRHLVIALDDWSWFARDAAIRPRLLAVVRRADPGLWSDQLRDETFRTRPVELDRLAAEVDLDSTPPNLIVLLFQIRPTAWPGGAEMVTGSTRRYPSDFWMQFEAGFYHHSKDRNRFKAVAHFRAAHALRPDLPAVAQMLGEALFNSSQPLEAIEYFREAVRLDPKLVAARVRLGEALRGTGQYGAAIAAYREVARLEPHDAITWNTIARIQQFDQRDLAGAIISLKEAARINPKNPFLHQNLGFALRDNEDHDGAVASFKEAIRLDPSSVGLRIHLGEELQASGDFKQAILEYEEALRLVTIKPDDLRITALMRAHAHNMLAWLLAAGPDGIRNGRRAIELSTRACELTDWKNPDCLDTLAAAHAETGNFENAVEHETQALNLGVSIYRGSENCRRRLDLYMHKKPFRLRATAPFPREVKR